MEFLSSRGRVCVFVDDELKKYVFELWLHVGMSKNKGGLSKIGWFVAIVRGSGLEVG